LSEALVIDGLARPRRRLGEARRLGIGIAEERGLAEAAVARPEAAAADLVRIGFLHDPGAEVRRLAHQRGRPAPGEARDRQVEAAPEEMHRADLAEERRAEPGE